MLRDLINNKFYDLLKKDSSEEKFPFNFRGELEILGYRNGELFHQDKQHNIITLWAKHSTMHLLTGDVFTSVGTTRSTTASDHGDTSGDSRYNRDGTMISGEQYFANPSWLGTNGWWSRPIEGDSITNLYSFFPTKMLFGTGFEWNNWLDIGDSDYYTQYIAGAWNSTYFDNLVIGDAANSYSAWYDSAGDSYNYMRSMNDIYSAALTTPALTDTTYAVKGAIKNALYHSNKGDSTNLETLGGKLFPKKSHWGIGRPAFIYAKRDARFYQSGSEVSLTFDSTVENKITFTVTMPEQTGANAGIFYPYNGFVLKEAGLFCDAKFRLRSTTPANDAGSDDSGLTEFTNYSSMPHGILFAKRYIAPITKSHDVAITARWTIYL